MEELIKALQDAKKAVLIADDMAIERREKITLLLEIAQELTEGING